MSDRDSNLRPARTELVLRTPPNWVAVGFFGILCLLHLCNAINSFAHGRWEGYMSSIFATIFLIAAITAVKANVELTVIPAERRIKIRSGVGKRCRIQRVVYFNEIRGVRLTLCGTPRHDESHLQLICALEDIECPPTSIPREEALWLAVTMNVPLTKVMSNGYEIDRSTRLARCQ